VDHSLFDHEGPWTEAAYLALKHDGRVEVVDGTLLIGPGASPRRSRAIERVRAAVAAALPDGLVVRGPVPLRLGLDCVLVPDLIVTAASSPDDDAEEAEGKGVGEPAEGEPAADDTDTAVLETTVPETTAIESAVLDAAAALLVIEVVGSDHGATDRSFKLQLYARSRIPYSLLLDHDGPFAVADMIIGGRYHEYARAGGDETLLIEEPFRLELDLGEITAPEPAKPAEPPASSSESSAEAAPTQALPVVPTQGPGVKA
jgi:Putative restriction endonuclease